MLDYKQKRVIRSVIFSYPTLGVLLAIVALLSVSVFQRFTIEREMAGRREAAEAELELLKQRAAAIEAQVEYLEEERGLEAEIRGRFDVVKTGEEVVVILDDPKEETQVPPPPPPPKPWYKFW
jgi:cell division protein FtsB